MVFLLNFFLSFVFLIFFGKTSLVMTYHLHQWDTISHLLLESLKLISSLSITSYFPIVITILLAKTLYHVLIYAHPGPGLIVDLHYPVLKFTIVMLWLLQVIEALDCTSRCFQSLFFNAVSNVIALHFCGKNSFMFLFVCRV